MKITVAICVHNRFDNIKLWVNCWRQCNTENAELVIVHNYYEDEGLRRKFEKYSEENNIKYIPREHEGYDIGAFQDVCRERLKGFPDFDYLLWACDDTIPMTRDFIKPFLDKLTDGVGVVCMDLSPYVRTHIRTTGFLIRRETANKLTFEVDPIISKEDCYRFEHRDPVNWFYQQIINLRLSVLQVDARESSPLWDMGYKRGLKRMAEHEKIFPSLVRDKVVFICPIFDAFPEIISSLICQTYKDWELLLIDDNPAETVCKTLVEALKDDRIKYIKRPRAEKWGHPHRQWALEEIKHERLAREANFIVIGNGDNYHVPTYIEYMIAGFKNNPSAVAVYCSHMVHSYTKWGVIACRMQLGYVDCCGVMVRKEAACEAGWESMEHSSDWTYFNSIINKYGAGSFAIVKGCLIVHN